MQVVVGLRKCIIFDARLDLFVLSGNMMDAAIPVFR